MSDVGRRCWDTGMYFSLMELEAIIPKEEVPPRIMMLWLLSTAWDLRNCIGSRLVLVNAVIRTRYYLKYT